METSVGERIQGLCRTRAGSSEPSCYLATIFFRLLLCLRSATRAISRRFPLGCLCAIKVRLGRGFFLVASVPSKFELWNIPVCAQRTSAPSTLSFSSSLQSGDRAFRRGVVDVDGAASIKNRY
jgi:hypothetical protein